jgi:hypothetical protein
VALKGVKLSGACAQVIFDLGKAAFVDGLPLEMSVAAKVRHRAIVQTLAYDLVEDPDHAEQSVSPFEGWIVMELMDRGSLGVSFPLPARPLPPFSSLSPLSLSLSRALLVPSHMCMQPQYP